MGFGSFADARKEDLSWTQWSQHLMHYYDGRFADHARFRYFLLNTHERELANKQANLFVQDNEKYLSVGDVRNLSKVCGR